VDVDKNAICEALKKFASEGIKAIFPIEAQARAYQLPVMNTIQEFRESLEVIEVGSSDDCVNTLAGGGASLKLAHDRIRQITECLDEKGLTALRQARQVVGQMWPQLEARGEVGLREDVGKLKGLLSSEDFYESLSAISAIAKMVSVAYRTLYEKAHADRSEEYHSAIERIMGRFEWEIVPESMRQSVLQPLTSRSCTKLELSEGSFLCEVCGATLSQLESDLAALGGLFAQVVAQVQKLTTPPEIKVERVRVYEFFNGAMENPEQVRQAVARLQDYLLKLLDEKIKIVVE